MNAHIARTAYKPLWVSFCACFDLSSIMFTVYLPAHEQTNFTNYLQMGQTRVSPNSYGLPSLHGNLPMNCSGD